ncbi:hypothetical protein VCHA53O466_140091 [Vibrio chagasii]|nr:hypothetical protein VCHA53O466_140091 [Vibrio chagasii]
MTKRIQHRSECSFCGRTHAVKGSYVVAHGYTVDYHQFNNICIGANAPHYGDKDAPEAINGFIATYKNYLESLPQIIADLASRLEVIENDPTLTGNQLRKATSGIKREIRTCTFNKDKGIPELLTSLEARIANWKEYSALEVDVEVEEKEARAKRQAEAQAKKLKKEQEEADKQARKLERENKALEKHKKRLEQLSQGVHIQIFFRGELVKELSQSFESERDLFDTINPELRKIWSEKGDGSEFHGYVLSDFLYEVKTKPDGKGTCLERFTMFNSRKKYFDVFSD